ncbi:prephenate dehydrogenase/arogenate dehydrogenase family protein [Chitinimonas arctica]|uniref:Prephenate dehydrogenase/arogenate dehydrogenase family protein n=1 Tax=Chitinimonas arctica TaxID=2594795 RepID=A0A516SIZ2_9NEIS|nr:prephenate dehydrogenase/arogenate dehydrogenase family protein [Chitinimonas arctica]QDQ28111.1 prephenate dehydrogenase/arogenate dehydrogenase family protein [Chitinimonas arctica]
MREVAVAKLVVIGVGLIGGSFALDLRRAGAVREVVGVGRSADNLARALQLRVVDAASQDAAAAVADADLVLLATPVGQMDALLGGIAASLPRHAIVMDAGSTKRDVAALFRRHLADSLDRCIPAHPIAGSDLSGAAAARYSLYEGRKVVLCPLPETAPAVVERVSALWRICGADLVCLDAEQHDAVFAAVSHLPHLLAFGYMNTILARPDADTCLALAASGFRDFTRIAGGHPEMWRDIALANRDSLLRDLGAFRQQLDLLIGQLEAKDSDALAAAFATASQARQAWPPAR